MSNDEQDLEPTPQEAGPPKELPTTDELPSMVSPNYLTELGRQFLNTPLSEAAATWTPYIVPETPTTTNTETHTLQYEGPSDTVYVAIHKGDRLIVSPEMEPMIQRLLAEGHQFSTVD